MPAFSIRAGTGITEDRYVPIGCREDRNSLPHDRCAPAPRWGEGADRRWRSGIASIAERRHTHHRKLLLGLSATASLPCRTASSSIAVLGSATADVRLSPAAAQMQNYESAPTV